MKQLVVWFGKRRKFFAAAAAGTIPVAAHLLGVAPFAAIPSGAVWYTFYVYELGALGVHAITNDADVEPDVPSGMPGEQGP